MEVASSGTRANCVQPPDWLGRGRIARCGHSGHQPNARDSGGRPDIIHGHHYLATLGAAQWWHDVPAIGFCHDHLALADRTPFHPSIVRYAAVSKVCMDRLLREGVPADRALLLLNSVDTDRFIPRAPLPTRPKRALLFSNYAHAGTQLPAVMEACRSAGLELKVIGSGVGKHIDNPEVVLGQYDIVFAKAKAAMEAMAVGNAGHPVRLQRCWAHGYVSNV